MAGLGAAGSGDGGGQTKGAGLSSSALETLGAGHGASPVTRPKASRLDPAAHLPPKGRMSWSARPKTRAMAGVLCLCLVPSVCMQHCPKEHLFRVC